MPVMEILNERFARDASDTLFRFIGRMAEVTVESFELMKYGDFLKKLPVPSSLNLFRIDPLRGSSLFFFDAKFAFLLVDILFGGPGKSRMKIEGRNFTTIENRLLRRLLDTLFEDLKKEWSVLRELTFRYVRSEMNLHFLNLAAPTDIVLSTMFQVSLEWDRALIGYCIPFSTVEPIKDRLYGRFQSDSDEIDQAWRHRIGEHLQMLPLEMSVEMGTTQASLRRVLSLQVGDVLRLNVGPEDPMTLMIEGIPKGTCRAGHRNGRYAVEMFSMFRNFDKERKSGQPSRSRQIQSPGRSQLEGGLVREEPGVSKA